LHLIFSILGVYRKNPYSQKAMELPLMSHIARQESHKSEFGYGSSTSSFAANLIWK
jgi:hypothetical protein